ncbi:MAG: GDP-mannose 4,6-dehydratase [Schwartzia sp.]|nr:GDP-mannose 4,6-dehydratase [Schwartzia sp. (in: firmicutes)]MBR1885901.1 GDP-mannose 4,6-dehydratase [Schwartzia sp. (in: firmicutes)]
METGRVLVEINSRYFRPAAVDLLLGDPSKAERVLVWKRKVDFKGLVRMLARADIESMGEG